MPCRNNLHNHLRRWGPYHKPKCVQCPFTFTTWVEHQAHVKEAHENLWRYICGLCDVVFTTTDERTRHRKRDHESRLKTTVSLNAALHHMRYTYIYVLITIIFKVCDLCGKDVKMINQHKQNVHGVTLGFDFPCKICERTFIDQRALVIHMGHIHTDRKPPPLKNSQEKKENARAVCTYCGVIYKTQQGLQIHLANKHTAEADLPLK